jgi:hypothetical protein
MKLRAMPDARMGLLKRIQIELIEMELRFLHRAQA